MHHVENCEKEPLRAYEVNAFGATELGYSGAGVGCEASAREYGLCV